MLSWEGETDELYEGPSTNDIGEGSFKQDILQNKAIRKTGKKTNLPYGAVHLCTTNFVQMPIHWQKNLNFILLQGARFLLRETYRCSV